MKPDPAAKHAVTYALQDLNLAVKELFKQANEIVAGRKVRILSEYNGQPYGRSRKPLTGQEMTVERIANIDPHWGVSLFLRGERVAIGIKEIEWL